MANNTVNITNSNNTVTITPQDNNTLNTKTTTTSVSVTQGSTSVVTVNTPGPRGATGIQGEGATIDTGSFITTSSFTTYTGSVDSTFAGTSSFATTSSFAITSSYISGDNVDGAVSSATTATTATSATTATTATNTNNVYIDFGTTDTIMRIPMTTGTSDGYHQLKSPTSEILYYRGYGNPITGQSNSNDYLYIGGGSNTAGGIFLNSTLSLNNFIYSDFGTLYIQADDQFGSNNESYPAALEMTTYTGSAAATSGSNYIKLLSTDIILENGVSGSTQITGSIDVTGSITASNSIQIGPNTAALFGRSDRSSLAVGRTPYLYAGNNAFQADLFYTYNQGSANTPALYIGTNGGGAGRGIYASGHGLRFSANNSTTFYFDGAANTGTYGPSIGIGTDPVANLDIKTLRTPYDYFRISGSSGFSVETDLSASAETFMISKSGDVGIGTWSPTHKLTVVGSVSASAFVGDGSTLDNVVGLPHTGSLITSGGMVTLNTADYALRDSSQVPGYRVKTREGIYVGTNGDSAQAFGMYYGYNQIKYNNGYNRPSLTFGTSDLTFSHEANAPTFHASTGIKIGGGIGNKIGITGGNDLDLTITGHYDAATDDLGQSYIKMFGPNHNPNKGKLIIAAGNNSQHGHIQFYTTGSERMRITHSGSIGIGVTDPQTNLHVSGTVSASSFSGDGSNLTGIETDPFPYTGSAVISGSLEVIGDITGSEALLNSIVPSEGSVRIGYQAGQNVNSNAEVAIGYQALATHTGYSGIAIGYQAARNMSQPNDIVHIGYAAGTNAGTSGNTIFIGRDAGYNRGNSNNAIALGTRAMRDGSGNSIGIGNNALSKTVGDGNIAIGNQAGGLYNNTRNISDSVMIGDYAGRDNNGSKNILIGGGAGQSGANFINSVAIGYEAAYNQSGSNNVILGYQAGYNLTGSNQLIIANNSSSALITGDFANNTLDISGSSTIIGSGSNPSNTIFSVENPFSSQTNLFNIGEKGDIAFQGSPVSSRIISSTYPEIKLWNGQGIIGFNGGTFVLRAGKRFAIHHHPAYTEGIRFGTFGGSYYAGFYNKKLGIGTATPSEKITVEGNISASAYLGSVTDITPPNTTTTASLDCSLSNFFTLTLSSSNNIHLTSSNITAGQSINLRIIQPATSGSLTYEDTFKFPNGAPYEVSATHSVEDIVSFISFDSSTLYGSSLKNFE